GGHQLAAGVAVPNAGDGLVQLVHLHRLGVPAKGGAVQNAGNGQPRVVDVGVVTPVGVQKTDGMVLVGMVAHGPDVGVGVPVQGYPAVPGADARAGILGDAAGGNIPDLVLPLVGQVAPVQADGLLGQFGAALGEPPHDVAPEHGDAALADQVLAKGFHMADVEGL